MKSISKLTSIILIILIISACNDKKVGPLVEKSTSDSVAIQKSVNKESIEGIYETQSDPNYTDKCEISVEITKTKDGYAYYLKTSSRKVNGKATFSTNESGEKYLVLEGIKWDEYEGDISNEEESDSITDSKTETPEPEIPVGIDASYVKDTLTIQNYGNSMNSYTKISECGRKYIQLIKK